MSDEEIKSHSLTGQINQAILDHQEIAKAALDTAVDAIITINEHGHIELFNPAAEKIFGYSADELIGRNVSHLMPQPYRSEHDSYIQNFLTTGIKKIIGIGREVSGMRKDGTVFPLELAVSQVRLKNRILFTGVIRDITERKAAENALQREIDARRTIEEALRRSNKKLEEQANELMEATRLKSEFLANMSHELRTPMNSIIGFTSRVIKKAGHLLPDKQLSNLAIVQRNANHLLQLINDVLDLSKIEAGKMEVFVEDITVKDLVQEVAELAQPLMGGKDIRLVSTIQDQSIHINSDTTKLKQVLINLVGNAAKFTEQGTITISANYVENAAKSMLELSDNHDYLELSITDTGVGMREEELQYIFEAFRQVDGSLTRKTGGTGLGLAITKNLVQLLGGKINVESKKNIGTRFKLYIPTNADLMSQQSLHIQSMVDIPKQILHREQVRVLCIDDNPEVLALLQGILTDEGFDVVSALSAEEGIRLAKQCQPSIITLDIVMPGRDGWEVLKELKQSDETKNIPVVAVTFTDEKGRAIKLGATDFLVKPITPEKLQNIFKKILSRPPRNILAVDDDESTLELIQQFLEDEQIIFRKAKNGSQALVCAREQKPDLILLDLIMPGMDGFETIQQLQKDSNLANIPVCVVTGKELTESEYEFLNNTVESVISKEGKELTQTLNDILRNISQISRVQKKNKQALATETD